MIKNPLAMNPEPGLAEPAETMSVHSEANIPVWTESMPEAQQRAANEGKLIMALFTGSDWCTYCKKLERDVFSEPEFQNWASQNVVALKLDYPKLSRQSPAVAQQNKALLSQYGTEVRGYPTILFLDANGQIVDRMTNNARANAWVEQANSKVARVTIR
ncbi:MAG: thioredoxin family protein [Pirellulaceae bacterium]